jgi:hypothetical protein
MWPMPSRPGTIGERIVEIGLTSRRGNLWGPSRSHRRRRQIGSGGWAIGSVALSHDRGGDRQVRTWAWFGHGHGSDMGMVSPSRVRCSVSHSVSPQRVVQRVSPACQSSVPAQWVGPVGGPRVHLVRPRLGRNQKGQWSREPQAASGCMAIMAIADETAAPRLRRGAPARGPPAKRRTA